MRQPKTSIKAKLSVKCCAGNEASHNAHTHKAHTQSIAVPKVRPATGQHSNSPHTIAFASVRGRSAGTWPTQGNQSTRALALARSRSLSKERRLEKCKQARQRSLTKAAQLILVFFFLFFFVDSDCSSNCSSFACDIAVSYG